MIFLFFIIYTSYLTNLFIIFYTEYTTLYPDGAPESINQKHVRGKLYPPASSPSDAKRLRKLASSKVIQEPTTELEVGEIREALFLPQKSDESTKKTPLTTSALLQKRPHTFEQG